MISSLALILALATGNNPGAATCNGADPAITNVSSAVSRNPAEANQYTLTVTVTNLGSKNQPGNVLQSVVIILDRAKNGEKGIPPLRAGQKYSFTYDVLRASGAARGTTVVNFHLVMHQPAGAGAQDCSTSNDSYREVI
jgi:hypothetical protein